MLPLMAICVVEVSRVLPLMALCVVEVGILQFGKKSFSIIFCMSNLQVIPNFATILFYFGILVYSKKATPRKLIQHVLQ